MHQKLVQDHGMKRGMRSPLLNQVPPVIQGSNVPPFSLSILHMIPVLIVRWMREIFEFDQPYKQTESKIK